MTIPLVLFIDELLKYQEGLLYQPQSFISTLIRSFNI